MSVYLTKYLPNLFLFNNLYIWTFSAVVSIMFCYGCTHKYHNTLINECHSM